jgi:hypothetical protein
MPRRTSPVDLESHGVVEAPSTGRFPLLGVVTRAQRNQRGVVARSNRLATCGAQSAHAGVFGGLRTKLARFVHGPTVYTGFADLREKRDAPHVSHMRLGCQSSGPVLQQSRGHSSE